MGKRKRQKTHSKAVEVEESQAKVIKLEPQPVELGSDAVGDGSADESRAALPNTTTTNTSGRNESTADWNVSSRVNDWIQEQLGEVTFLEALIEQADETGNAEEEEMTAEEWKEIMHRATRTILKDNTKQEKEKYFKYECEWKNCSFLSGHDRKYFRHVESHAESARPDKYGCLECEWDLCNYECSNADDFLGHVHYHAHHTKLKVHGASITMLVKMPACNYDGRNRNNISNRPTRYECKWDNCKETFNRVVVFYHHAKNHVRDEFPLDSHTAPEPVPCRWSLCEQKFTTLQKAFKHFQSHTSERVIACPSCGIECYERLKFRDHLHRQLDSRLRTYQCQICEKTFATQRLHNTHYESHLNHVPCTMCSAKFPNNTKLTRHVLTKHLKQRAFPCTKCEYKAYSSKELTKHMITHENLVLRCEMFSCDRTFSSEYSLKKHLAEHYGIPPCRYACHLCDIVYTAGNTLTKHLLFRHKFERPSGSFRLRYALDPTDGLWRLASYLRDRPAATSADSGIKPVEETQKELATSGDESAGEEEESTSTVGGEEEEEEEEEVEEEEEEPAVQGKPVIKQIEVVGNRKVAIELAFEGGVEEKPLQSVAPTTSSKRSSKKERTSSAAIKEVKEEQLPAQQPPVDGKKGKGPKQVQEFTVMQRYLKTGKLTKS